MKDDIMGETHRSNLKKVKRSKRHKRPENMHDPRDTARAIKEEGIRDGDYVYTVGMQGVFFVSDPAC